MHTSDQKKRLRESIKERLQRFPKHKREAESRSLIRRILEELPLVSRRFKSPANHDQPLMQICAYYSLTDEADIRPLLEEILKQGYKLFLPRFQSGQLTFRRVEDLKGLIPGALNIPEPLASAPLLNEKEPTLILVPGRAFDLKGNRMGRGNGGYDKWIAQKRKDKAPFTYWGVALECQIVDKIPLEPHDQKVDAVVTARGLVKIDN